MSKFTYTVNELLSEDKKSFVVPQEVADDAGLKEGDKIKILLGDQGTVIIEKMEDGDSNGQVES